MFFRKLSTALKNALIVLVPTIIPIIYVVSVYFDL